MKRKVYKELANRIIAVENCKKSNNETWEDKHSEVIEYIENNVLPSGSGINSGTTIDLEKSNRDKLVLIAEYDYMNESGFYMYTIPFVVTVKPSLLFDFELTIKGNFGKQQDIKEYLYDVYREVLSREYDFNQIVLKGE